MSSHPRSRSSFVTVLGAAAVLLAVSGGSYAAALITGADVKNGSLTGKDVKDKSLSPRDFKGSVAGPKGATGATGATGPQGPAGPFPDVLPSGKTLSGVYSITGVASAADQYFDQPISFGFRFATPPDVVIVGVDDTTQEASAAGCPGTANDPKAAPGKMCLYAYGSENVDPTGDTKLETDGDEAMIEPYFGQFTQGAESSTFGTTLEVYSLAAGNLYANGTWAATSP
jgi:hypothetical protein